MKKIVQAVAFSFLGFTAVAQSTVSIIVHTDDYAYEGYWQLVPSGNACGTGTIASGGNAAVGCNGAGDQVQAPGGYANNIESIEGPWILTDGAQYDLIYTDDWGDGGFQFDVIVNGYQIESFEGMALGGTFPFTVQEPPAYDVSVSKSNLYAYVATGMYDIHAHLFNGGTTTITSFDLNYTVNGGAVNTHNVTGVNWDNFESEEVMHSIPLDVPTNGVYDIKLWASNLNGGNLDLNPANDTLTRQIEAGPGIPNILDGYINAPTIVNQIAGSAQQVAAPTDLDFHPVLTNNELWVINKGTENSGGSTVTIYNAGEANQTSLWKQDGNAWHFMSLPTGMAFSQTGDWASSPGVYDANHNGGDAFTGPTLWSSFMGIYAEPSGGNGSHLDMLHLSPYSQGIASEKDNVFWVFDGYSNDIVRYDFQEDHGPGNDFHGDAIVRRFSDDAVARDPNHQIVSHLVLDGNKQWLYVVDHGNGRVIRIDINTGSDQGGTPVYPMNETLVEYSVYTGYTQENVVTGLSKPAGIDVVGDRMIVSEYQTGEIILYDISTMPAVELERISTGLSSVQGIKVGPDGLIWFVDHTSNGVYKINSGDMGLGTQTLEFTMYPNPTEGELTISVGSAIEGVVEIRDLQGKLKQTALISGHEVSVDLEAATGMYFVSILSNGIRSETQRIVIK